MAKGKTAGNPALKKKRRTPLKWFKDKKTKRTKKKLKTNLNKAIEIQTSSIAVAKTAEGIAERKRVLKNMQLLNDKLAKGRPLTPDEHKLAQLVAKTYVEEMPRAQASKKLGIEDREAARLIRILRNEAMEARAPEPPAQTPQPRPARQAPSPPEQPRGEGPTFSVVPRPPGERRPASPEPESRGRRVEFRRGGQPEEQPKKTAIKQRILAKEEPKSPAEAEIKRELDDVFSDIAPTDAELAEIEKDLENIKVKPKETETERKIRELKETIVEPDIERLTKIKPRATEKEKEEYSEIYKDVLVDEKKKIEELKKLDVNHEDRKKQIEGLNSEIEMYGFADMRNPANVAQFDAFIDVLEIASKEAPYESNNSMLKGAKNTIEKHIKDATKRNAHQDVAKLKEGLKVIEEAEKRLKKKK